MLPFSKEIPKEMFPIITYNGSHSLELKPLGRKDLELLLKLLELGELVLDLRRQLLHAFTAAWTSRAT